MSELSANEAATIGCAKCKEFHAYDTIEDAQAELWLLRDRDVDHDHSGLSVVIKKWNNVW